MGEVPKAERACFTLSVGSAASSPRVGAKGGRIVTSAVGLLTMTFFFRELVQNDTERYPMVHRYQTSRARIVCGDPPPGC